MCGQHFDRHNETCCSLCFLGCWCWSCFVWPPCIVTTFFFSVFLCTSFLFFRPTLPTKSVRRAHRMLWNSSPTNVPSIWGCVAWWPCNTCCTECQCLSTDGGARIRSFLHAMTRLRGAETEREMCSCEGVCISVVVRGFAGKSVPFDYPFGSAAHYGQQVVIVARAWLKYAPVTSLARVGIVTAVCGGAACGNTIGVRVQHHPIPCCAQLLLGSFRFLSRGLWHHGSI